MEVCGSEHDVYFGGKINHHFAGASSPEQASTPSASTSNPDTPSDRNSIGFLLNMPGEADFMREFPKSSTMSPNNTAEVLQMAPLRSGAFGAIGSEAPTDHAYRDQSQTHANNLDDLLSNLEFQKTYERQTKSWQAADNTVPWSGPNNHFLDLAVLGQRAYDIKEKLKYTVTTQASPHAPLREVLEAMDLITGHNIVIYIRLYFKHWHKHAPIIHEPTFNPCTAALPLVLALMCLGGMVRMIF